MLKGTLYADGCLGSKYALSDKHLPLINQSFTITKTSITDMKHTLKKALQRL